MRARPPGGGDQEYTRGPPHRLRTLGCNGSDLCGQDLGTVVRDGDRVLEMGGERAVARHDGPAVREDPVLLAAEREHRLDGDREPRTELGTATGRPPVLD